MRIIIRRPNDISFGRLVTQKAHQNFFWKFAFRYVGVINNHIFLFQSAKLRNFLEICKKNRIKCDFSGVS